MIARPVYDVTLFGLEFRLSPIIFSLGPVDVRWYGVLIMLGTALAYIYAHRRAEKFGVDKTKIIDCVLLAAPLAIIFSRLYYVIFAAIDPTHRFQVDTFWDIFRIDQGGLAIYGAVIGGFLGGYIMCKIRKINVIDMFDLCAPGFLIGQAIGRIGNFFNQEAFGEVTSRSFGMMSQRTGGEYVQPIMLYEAVWCAIGFFVIHHLSKYRKAKGEVFLAYIIWYGFGRAILEGFRTDSLMLGPIRVSQGLAIAACIAATIIFIVRRVRFKDDLQEEKAEVEA